MESGSAPAHYWLGMAYYEQERYNEAESEFQRTIRLDKKWSMGHVGLGLAYMRIPNRRMDARAALRTAADLDPNDAQIQYYLGMTYMGQSRTGRLISAEVDGRAYFQKAVALNPNHPDAYFQLGLSSEYPIQEYDRAVFFYFKQLTVTPNHREALLRLGRVCYVTKRYEEGRNLISQLIDMHGDRMAPLFRTVRAQMEACYQHTHHAYAEAWDAYQEYLASVDEQERVLYADLQYIASPEEYKTFQAATDAEKTEIRRKFWASRDPNPATVLNERLLEHYRRVMFAREHFAGGKNPWDRRGDIHIRYGAPDDRQRFLGGSNEGDTFMTAQNPLQTSVREMSSRGRDNESDFIAPTGKPDVDAIRELNRAFRYRLRARGAHASESWVYVRYKLELFFVDQRGDGIYDYPDIMMDPTAMLDLTAAGRQERFRPETLAELLIARIPEEYTHDFGGEPLQFVFDTVTYRGEGGRTDVELTFSLPVWQLGSVQDGQGLRTWLDGHVTMRDADFRPVIALAERFGPIDRPATPQTNRQFNVRLYTTAVSFPAAAGAYETAVEIKDEASRRIGVYKKPSVVSDYHGDSLMVSDLKLSTAIEPDDITGQFVRSGLRIDPNPGRLYQRGQPVYVYYEIYNLTLDDIGDTAYETVYEITPKGDVLKRRRAQRPDGAQSVLLSFDGAGTTPDEPRYTSLDTTDLEPGEYALTLILKDRASGQRVFKTTSFVVLGEAPEE